MARELKMKETDASATGPGANTNLFLPPWVLSFCLPAFLKFGHLPAPPSPHPSSAWSILLSTRFFLVKCTNSIPPKPLYLL